MVACDVQIVECFDVPEEHVSGLACAERLSDGTMRFVLFTERRGEYVTSHVLNMAPERVIESMKATAAAMGLELYFVTCKPGKC